MEFDLEEFRPLRREFDAALREQRALIRSARDLRAGRPAPDILDEEWLTRWESAKDRREAAERAIEDFWRRKKE